VTAVAPKHREVTGWIIRPAAERTDRKQADLARILERCDSLRTVDRLVSDFAGTLRQRQGQHLDTLITQAKQSGVAQLAGFTAGLVKDYDAVRNGLTLPYSSGAVEGNVCRLRAIKSRCTAARTLTSAGSASSSPNSRHAAGGDGITNFVPEPFFTVR
jgi:transposase